MKFEKGQSGNPAGRPPGTTTKKISEELRAHLPKAIETLLQLMDSETDSVRLKAATEVLDRVYGKPAQVQVPDENKEEEMAKIARGVNRCRELSLEEWQAMVAKDKAKQAERQKLANSGGEKH
jgi:hypothetical protein